MLYLELFHGRPDPAADLDDWGEQGPVFGPLSFVHTTYGSVIHLGEPTAPFDTIGDLYIVEGLVYYNGMYYGDWSVSNDPTDLQRDRLVTYKELFATQPPATSEANKPAAFTLTEGEGLQLREILNRYINEELRPILENEDLANNDPEALREVEKDVDYITELAALFEKGR